MKIIILGSGTLHPSLKRTAAGIIVKPNTSPILIDSGSGIYYKLAHANIDFHDIGHYFYSHYEHPDHVNDLPFIIFAKKYDTRDFKKNITLVGPPGFIEFYNKIKGLYPILQELPFGLDIFEMQDEKKVVDNFSVISKPMSHGDVRCTGYRIEIEGKSIVYSGDTDYCTNLVELAKDADVLITECTVPDELKTPNHLSPETAGKIAAEACVKMLILTHMDPNCDNYDIEMQAVKAYSGKIIIASDMMQVDV